MNRIDHSIDKVAHRPRESHAETDVQKIRDEMRVLYTKAIDGTATQEDADRYSELTHELAEMEDRRG